MKEALARWKGTKLNSMTYHFVPFPSNSVPGGYLLWSDAELPAPVLWDAEHRFWAINYPLYGVHLSCFETAPGRWRLEARTFEVGTAPPLPLLVCTFSAAKGLSEDYRYSYPAGLVVAEEQERFDELLAQVSWCFKATTELLLEPETLGWASALEYGKVLEVQARAQYGEERSWHLRVNNENLYLVLGAADDAVGRCEVEVYRNRVDLPLAHIVFDFDQKTFEVVAGMGYVEERDAVPCAQLAEAMLATH